ncbi:4a-hydroxytetrahydrobiopterin dehydratase [Imhoffiella purpurea]|uniref:4a-hydroxytetrahydrobiopterin dehydratase n=1 Tax=Imhoffiella purpurea TaxID=1249627 RepID=W9VC71_9GAMM|nr:4a-hydroxytetrahydrobiopterin dehydratase [Imhoffiella purpurea]EXJ14581.1 Pterin-4-alpha-carbinolamine dehydratase [Imhoffiella purpurea]
MSDETIHSETEIQKRLQTELPRWRHADGRLCREYRTSGWKASLMVVNAVGHLAEAAWHHPDLAVSYASVTVTLTTHSANGITDKDFELAGRIEETLMWRPGAESALDGTPEDPRYAYLEYD